MPLQSIVVHYDLGVMSGLMSSLTAVLLIEHNDLWLLAKGCQLLVEKTGLPHFISDEKDIRVAQDTQSRIEPL